MFVKRFEIEIHPECRQAVVMAIPSNKCVPRTWLYICTLVLGLSCSQSVCVPAFVSRIFWFNNMLLTCAHSANGGI